LILCFLAACLSWQAAFFSWWPLRVPGSQVDFAGSYAPLSLSVLFLNSHKKRKELGLADVSRLESMKHLLKKFIYPSIISGFRLLPKIWKDSTAPLAASAIP